MTQTDTNSYRCQCPKGTPVEYIPEKHQKQIKTQAFGNVFNTPFFWTDDVSHENISDALEASRKNHYTGVVQHMHFPNLDEKLGPDNQCIYKIHNPLSISSLTGISVRADAVSTACDAKYVVNADGAGPVGRAM
jgi:hypothetical protein